MYQRKDYISWDDYFMGIAVLSKMRSKDPTTQVGCCIVDSNNRIVSVGYNGFANGISDDAFPWCKDKPDPLDNKYVYVVHAELNAILNSKKDLRGCRIYTSLYPCCECAKAIIQSGITKVIYQDEKGPGHYSQDASARMFEAAGIEVQQIKNRVSIQINTDETDYS